MARETVFIGFHIDFEEPLGLWNWDDEVACLQPVAFPSESET
jgi:hypothetical protein